jgi:hypothetical protein
MKGGRGLPRGLSRLGTRKEYPPLVNIALGNLISKGANSQGSISLAVDCSDIAAGDFAVDGCRLNGCILNNPTKIANPAAATTIRLTVCLFMFIRTMTGLVLI